MTWDARARAAAPWCKCYKHLLQTRGLLVARGLVLVVEGLLLTGGPRTGDLVAHGSAGPRDAQGHDLGVEIGTLQAEGARGGGEVPAGALERGLDVLPLAFRLEPPEGHAAGACE